MTKPIIRDILLIDLNAGNISKKRIKKIKIYETLAMQARQEFIDGTPGDIITIKILSGIMAHFDISESQTGSHKEGHFSEVMKIYGNLRIQSV